MSEQLDLEDWLRENPKTLTEQWKKGELKSGYYYIVTKYIEFPNRIDFYNSSAAAWSYHSSIFIEEVLAPVPSYEEWQDLREFADYSVHNRDELTKQINFWMDKHTQNTEENQQLKELLKQSLRYVWTVRNDVRTEYAGATNEQIDMLIENIDNAIGEKK